MPITKPATPEELAEALAYFAAQGKTITLGGSFSKNAAGGPVEPSSVTVSTGALRRVLAYNPQDLTLSVEAGMPFSDLHRLLASNRQMLPLDPPCFDCASVGGVIASNSSGPRRRLFGTARDLVIGMTYATLSGKLVQSGGMVVKNVAGLDTGKLLIGSFGTLAAIVSVNFKVLPAPEHTRTFTARFDRLEDAVAKRDAILRSVLQPAAIDLLNPAGSQHLGRSGYSLLIQAGGNEAIIDRYTRELAGFEPLDGGAEESLWRAVREFAPSLCASAGSTILRVSTTLGGIRQVLAAVSGPALVRAGNGVCYVAFASLGSAVEWMQRHDMPAVVEFAPPAEKSIGESLWPRPGSDFAIMKSIKTMFDPHGLLNRGRLFGRI